MRIIVSTMLLLTTLLAASMLQAQHVDAGVFENPTEHALPTKEASPSPIDLVAQHGGATLSYDLRIDGDPASAQYQRNADGDVRVDFKIKDPRTQLVVHTSVIVLAGTQDLAFNLIHTTRQMGRVDLPTSLTQERNRYLFEKLEPALVKGQPTQHVRLTDTQSGDEFELWLSSSAGNVQLMSRLLRSLQSYQGSIAQALQDHAQHGLPLKFKYTKRSTNKITTGEVTALALGTIDPNRFATPRGYRSSTMKSLNPMDTSTGPLGGLKRVFKSFGRRR